MRWITGTRIGLGAAVLCAGSLGGCYQGLGDSGRASGATAGADGADDGADDGDGDGGSDGADTDGDPAGNGNDPGRVTLRRLNNTEYDNTIRDLFYGLDVSPADTFPADEVSLGFDNIGDVLSVTPVLFELYERAAEQSIDAALASLSAGDAIHSEAEDLGGTTGAVCCGGFWNLSSNGSITAVVDTPVAASYTVTVRAYGQQAGPDLPHMTIEVDGLEVAAFDIAATSAAPGEFDVEVPLTAGPHQIAATFTNDFYDEALAADRNLYVDWIDVAGQGGPDSIRDKIMICDPTPGAEATCAQEIIETFAPRAWRRPLEASETTDLVAVFNLAMDEGSGFEAAVKVALKAVLVSPHFIFRVEIDPEPDSLVPHPVSDYELASRLSYFLWSTMPDDELFAVADAGMLSDPAVLEQQVARMLEDGRSEALVANFAGQWLYLRNLDHEIAKDYERFPEFDADLQASMRTESEMFFRTFVTEGRSLRELLTAEDTFVDARLAAHYGLPVPAGDGFERVSLTDHPRRGLLTQGGLMSVLSHPVTTSPVKRGKWVLEQLLCMSPPAPPPGVEIPPADPEVGGTMREQLAKHRADPTCAACHDLMDPIGLGLENYDAIGRYRDVDAGLTIDASGELPGGVAFQTGLEMLELLADGEDFPRCTVRHTLTYALGRGIEADDTPYLDEMVTDFEAGDMTIESLLLAIVGSDSFRMRRGEAN